MGLSTRLWEENQDLARACRDHPFVQGIASGELPRPRFAFYVGQDAFYLEAYARAYALALAKAPDRSTMLEFRDLMEGVFEELRLHQQYARRWNVDLAPQPAPATQAYTDFLLRVAWSEPVGRIVAAMTPCMRLYAHLGQALQPVTKAESPYREWVETYASQEIEDLTRRLERLLDACDPGDRGLAAHYRTAMRLELAFFDQAWHAHGPG
ncbi:TenA family protein [Limnochorda pilosa]|uniref:Aminopyrimidine aminohydrolase n=1 Tax=Limnochorda pilosa TaxID=1555112 RepID=A0A0K2SMU6_LIMPI|nr:TenA family protein [Limnochorda pilosa]BAS28139.1 TenA family transcriptional regulator [Limnochorda pilosa]